MTDVQLYMSVGIPSLLALLGILVNVSFFVFLSGRIDRMEARLDGRIDRLETRMDTRMSSIESKFDLLIGKVIEVDNRLSRVEEQLKHLH